MAPEGEGSGSGGGGGGDWRAALPEPLRADPSLASFKDVASLAQSLVETKRLVGASLRPPGPDAGADAWKAFTAQLAEKVPGVMVLPDDEKARAEVEDLAWQKMGRPAAPEGYEVGEGFTEQEVQKLREWASKRGLTKKQFQAELADATAAKAAAQAAAKEATEGLRKEWGAAYEERLVQAKAAALKMGLSEERVSAMPPDVLKAFAAVYKTWGGEPRQVAGQTGGASTALTPEEARLQQKEILANPDYWDGRKNARLMARMRELDRFAHPD